MAALHNEERNLRLNLQLVDRERQRLSPTESKPTAGPRVLGTFGIEFLEARDKEFWPLLRLPVIYLAHGDGEALLTAIRELCAQTRTGLAFTGGTQGELVLRLAAKEGGYLVETGVDLCGYLMETSGRVCTPGGNLAMFRFEVATGELVRFAGQLQQELEQLPPLKES